MISAQTAGMATKVTYSLILSTFLDIEMFLEGAELEGDMEDQNPDEQYASDF